MQFQIQVGLSGSTPYNGCRRRVEAKQFCETVDALAKWALIVPVLESDSMHVGMFGFFDLDMPLDSIKRGAANLFVSDKDGEHTYRTTNDIKERLWTWMRKQGDSLTVEALRRESAPFDQVCKVLIRLVECLDDPSLLVFFTGGKGFRVLSRAAMFYQQVPKHGSYGKKYLQFVLKPWLKQVDFEGLLLDACFDDGVYERNNGIKPDVNPHPLSRFWPALVGQITALDQVSLARANADRELSEAIRSHWSYVVANVPVSPPTLPVRASNTSATRASRNGDRVRPEHSSPPRSAAAPSVAAGRLTQAEVQRLADVLRCDHIEIDYKDTRGDVDIFTVANVNYCAIACRSHDSSGQIYYVLHRSTRRVVQKCHSSNCEGAKELLSSLCNEARLTVSEVQTLQARVKEYADQWSESDAVCELRSQLLEAEGEEVKSLRNRLKLKCDECSAGIVGMLNKQWCVIEGLTQVMYIEARPAPKRASGTEANECVDMLIRQAKPFHEANCTFTLSMLQPDDRHASGFAVKKCWVSQLWVNHADRRAYSKIAFHPQAEFAAPRAHCFNLWQGFDVTQTCSRQFDAESALPMMEHIRHIWCQDDPEAFDYCINWMASIVQRPWEKLSVAMVIRGEEGSGKGIVVELLRKIIGDAHFKHVTGMTEITGQFTGPVLRDCVLCLIDECAWAGDIVASNKLKTLITEKQHRIEEKYCSAYTTESYANYIITSNEPNVFRADAKARRFFAIETKSEYAGMQSAESHAYFQRLAEVTAGSFARILYERDLTAFNVQAAPATELLRQQKVVTMEGKPTGWLLERLRVGSFDGISEHVRFVQPRDASHWERCMLKDHVYSNFVDWAKHKSNRAPAANNVFWKEIKEAVGNNNVNEQQVSIREGPDGMSHRRMSIQFAPWSDCQAGFRLYVKDHGFEFGS